MRTLLPVTLLLAACGNGPRHEAWAPSENTGGPVVVWDALAKPLPEIPLPNNAATRLDPGSATGRFLNVSEEADTEYERDVRRKFNRLDGFGSFAPISVAFDKLLDLDDLWARHNGDGTTAPDDFRDDAVFLLNVDERCARYGEEVAFDLGRGRQVYTLYGRGRREADTLAPGGERWVHQANSLFPFDEHFDDNNFVFEENEEDLDDDGVLDPGEDVDFDGVLDHPNFRDVNACDGLAPATLAYDRCVADNLMSWYERETNTLILRPLWPLENRCTYAVVLSKRVRGADGTPIMSPFPGVNAVDQTEALKAATPLIGRYGLDLDDVAFAWTFTVGSNAIELMEVRRGLYGAGPLARLGTEFPADRMTLWTRRLLAETFGVEPEPSTADDTLLPGACFGAALTELWNDGLGEWNANMCTIEADTSSVAGWFGGTFPAPNFMVDKDGDATPNYAADQDETFDLDVFSGRATYGTTAPTFFCALPYEDPAAECAPGNPDGVPFCKPFPVIAFAHGYGSSRSEFTLHIGRHTAMGYAACAIDSYGHGFNRGIVDPVNAGALLLSIPRFQKYGAPELAAMLALGRDRDLNNDGLPDPGADQWTADIFHTRDMVRQSAIEVMQFVRLLRHMDGTTRGPDGRLLGDVDGDGTVDFGGPENTLGHWGISLGGIISAVLSGSEPGLDAVSPNAGGAGLTDVTVRSTQPGLPEAVVQPMMGQLISACLPTDGHDNPLPVGEAGGSDCLDGRGADGSVWMGGTLRLAFFNNDTAQFAVREVGSIEGVLPGDVVRVRNLSNGQEDVAPINVRGWTRAGIPADALDAIQRRKVLGWPDTGGVFDVPDATLVADALEIVVLRGDVEIGRVDTFQRTIEFQGSRYNEGSTLVALQRGFGYARNSPNVRRLLGFAQHAISGADPGAFTAHAFMYPPDLSYDPFDDGEPTRLLVMPTAGDSTVPAHTGVTMGRTSGTLGSWKRDETLGPEVGWRELFVVDPRYGTSKEQWLTDNYVSEADWRFQRWEGVDFNPNTVFDPDDLSDGTARFSCGPTDWSATNGENRCPEAFRTGEGEPENFFDVPNPAPGDALRATRDRGNGYVDGFRMPLLRPAGQHGIYNAQAFRVFDTDAYAVNLTARFLGTGGTNLDHEAGCDCGASAPPNVLLDGEPVFPGQGRECTPQPDPGNDPATLKVCSPACAAAWGVRTPAVATCVTE